jgi:arginine/lysine/ornithine decarboxylase
MKAPICEFVKKYAQSDASRFHMPGHKGASFLGCEKIDITEIDGADALYHARGIINESEENAAKLFGSGKTVYSTEGSSHVIRAMMYLAKSYKNEENGYVLATRNAHQSFISASALLGFDIKWLTPNKTSYLSGKVGGEEIEKALTCVDKLPFAVFVTSPDYLGNISDIQSISKACKRYGVPLIVDNAHGAYLKFLEKSEHPIDQGAWLTSDSAHKTLPVLTGGAYMHISKDAPAHFLENAKNALAIFGSSSPSYLTLCSLDNANTYLDDAFKCELKELCAKIDGTKARLTQVGYTLVGEEKTKITVDAKKYGYYGDEIYNILYKNGIVCEFYDKDYVVMMASCQNDDGDLKKLEDVLASIPKKSEIIDTSPDFSLCERKFTPREIAFLPKEEIAIENALGRVCGELNVTCPPCVSVISCGEIYNESAIELSKYYGKTKCTVLKEQMHSN